MSHRDITHGLNDLDLSPEFEDLEGLVEADLRAIVNMLTDRARDRLMLTRREAALLRSSLWNSLVGSIEEGLEPLSAEWR